MIKISKSDSLKLFVHLLILIAIAKVIALVALWYLPSEGVELSVKTSKQPKYRRIDFANMIKNTKVNSSSPSKGKDKGNSSSNISITSMILKGFYGSGTQGYAILALKKSPKKTSIIAIGEEFSSYKLKLIKPRSIVFTKAGKEYILNLQKIKKGSSITKIKSTPSNVRSVAETTTISRKDIQHYSKNPKEMWKDISIVPHKVNKKLVGFRVKRVKKNSKFESLGLKAKDIIIKANNVVLKSYKDVFNIYNKIDKLSTVQIVVLRNNQEKEFIYEID